MASLSFRDRFLTPRVARAIMSPLGMLLFGGVSAVGIVAGLPIIGAIGIGAAAWAAKVGAAVPRNKTEERVDAYALGEPWRDYVLSAQNAKERFDRTVNSTRSGPLRDRLKDLGDRLQVGIDDAWRIASRGDDIDRAVRHLNTAEAQLELSELRTQARQSGTSPSLQSTIESLEAQVESAQRMRATSQDARDRLRLLNARLDELVAKAVEVSVGTTDSTGLTNDVDDVVAELEALRQAVEETDRAARGVEPLPPELDLPVPGEQPRANTQPRSMPG